MRLSEALLPCVIATALVTAAAGAKAAVLIQIDRSAQRMTVSVDGAERWNWPVSTGAAGYTTPSGAFKPFRMEATHFSKEWDDAPMPHSIFFTKIGHAIHGTYDAAHLGRAVSHGCVRLSAANATQLFQLVKAEGMSNTQVVISGEQPYAEPEAYNQSRGQGYYGQNNYNQNTYGQNSDGQNSYSQSYHEQSWSGQNAYRQNSYGQNSYNQNSYQNSYGQNSRNQSPTAKRNGWSEDQRNGYYFFNSRY
jgi:L,D-transpeptidase catalytic domain